MTNHTPKKPKLYKPATTPRVVSANLFNEVVEHLSRFGCNRLVDELDQCVPLYDIRESGLGDK